MNSIQKKLRYDKLKTQKEHSCRELEEIIELLQEQIDDLTRKIHAQKINTKLPRMKKELWLKICEASKYQRKLINKKEIVKVHLVQFNCNS